MPEGHTIHRAARQQNRYFAGRRIAVSSPQGRFESGAALLDGETLDMVEAYGKHLFQYWRNGIVVHVHLGLFGRLRLTRGNRLPPVAGAVRMRMTSDVATLDLIGPSVCAVGSLEDRDNVIGRLGPDPLRPDSDSRRFVERVERSPARIGTLIMDQSVIAGVGNAFRAEALFLVGIHPERRGQDLGSGVAVELWRTLRRLMSAGVRSGGIITVRAAERGAGFDDPRPYADDRYVYQRQRCRRCGTEVERWRLQGRVAYACPQCQR
jgi:endonuclease VIII